MFEYTGLEWTGASKTNGGRSRLSGLPRPGQLSQLSLSVIPTPSYLFFNHYAFPAQCSDTLGQYSHTPTCARIFQYTNSFNVPI
ncbi:hypothetical protein J6590_048807 [Homalodisca vitripennis]|nr:hypothetical protein J6590_048807 [Homalodisca vitripennis]